MDEGITLLGFITIVCIFIFGFNKCFNALDESQKNHNQILMKCAKICDPHPVAYANQKDCSCNVGIERRKMEQNEK